MENNRRVIYGPRGFLSNYPEDVVAVVNGTPITKADILHNKRQKQQRRLDRIRRSTESIIRPCFVWTFYNEGPFYGGWWLYVRTLKCYWEVRDAKQQLKIMQLFPCGYSPVFENFTAWKAEFAKIYHHPTVKRPNNQGMAIARAVVSDIGNLLDVLPRQWRD